MSAFMVCIVLDSGREESVDECSFPQARLSSNLYAHLSVNSLSPLLGRNLFRERGVIRTIIVKAAPRFATILCLFNSSQLSLAAPEKRIPLVHTVGLAAMRTVSYDPCP